MTLDQRYWMWDLVLLLALAIALRLQGLGTLSLGEDEVSTALAARSLLHSEGLPNQQNSLNLPMGPLEWLTAQGFRIFGVSEWSARFIPALVGVLTVMWVYLWGSHWFGAWTGRIGGFFFAIWPWSVKYGREATVDGLLLLLAFLFAISIWKVIEGNCLGHPMMAPPLVAGRKPLVLRRFLKVLPMMILGFLCLLISPAAVFVLLLLPAYLVARLFWSWLRGRTEDCEFKRSLLYLLAGLVYVSLAAAIVVWRDLDILKTSWGQKTEDMWPRIVSHAGISEFILGGFLLVGTGRAALRGRPGWLVILGAWLPVFGWLFLPFLEDLYHVSPSVPFLFILLAMPFAWAFEVARESLNHWAVERKHLSWRLVVSLPLLIGGILFVTWNVLGSPNGTAAVLNGTISTSRGKTADWRLISSYAPGIGDRAAIVTTNPLLCLYYLGRADFVYPDPASSLSGKDRQTGIPVLPDGRALLDFIESGHEVWIVGSRASFDKTLKTREGAVLWASITQPPSRIWEGPGEVVICWRGSLP